MFALWIEFGIVLISILLERSIWPRNSLEKWEESTTFQILGHSLHFYYWTFRALQSGLTDQLFRIVIEIFWF